MKAHITVIALCTFVAGTATAADPSEPLKASFEGRYRELKMAMADRDAASVKALLAPDFVSEDTSGNKENTDAMLRELAVLPKDPNKASETTVVSVERNRNSAVVVRRYHMTTTKPGSEGSVKHIDLVTISRDTWRLLSGLWLLSKTITQRLDYSIDGQPAAHKEHVE